MTAAINHCCQVKVRRASSTLLGRGCRERSIVVLTSIAGTVPPITVSTASTSFIAPAAASASSAGAAGARPSRKATSSRTRLRAAPPTYSQIWSRVRPRSHRITSRM